MFGMLLCAGFAACSDDPDSPMDTIPYTRLLTPLNFEAEVIASVGTDITFSWSTMESADGYVLQLFEAVGEEGAEPVYEEATPAFEYEVTPENVPYVAQDLGVDMTYWARVRAVSESLEPSHWAVLKESVSTSAVRSDLHPVVVGRTTTSVTLTWDNAEDKTDLTSVRVELVVAEEGAEPRLVTLTNDHKSAAEVSILDLEPCKNYKFTLLFGKSGKRGVVTAWTRPETGNATHVNSAEAIFNAINGATAEVSLLVAQGEYDFTGLVTDLASGINVTAPLTIYGETAEDGTYPVLKNLAFVLGDAAVTKVHLEDLSLDGNNVCGATVTNNAAPLTALEVVNCELANYTKGIYSVSSSSTGSAEKVLFSGVYAHDINPDGSVGGDFIDIRAGLHADVECVNSTFYACARTFIRLTKDNATAGKVNVHNCTFNYVTSTKSSSNNAGIFNVRQKVEPTEILCSNNVFLNMYHDNETEDTNWVRLCRNSSDSYAPVCSGNIYYNVGPAWFVSAATFIEGGATFTESDAMAGNGLLLENDPCVNSAAGKLYLTDGTIAANKAGDPRWWNATEPVVVRATSLEVVNEPTVWDFTEKTIYQTETIENTTIIDNIKFYGPAELKMSEGVTFTQAGVMDGNEPVSGALLFKANGYGAVVVSTVDAGYNGSVQVIAGGDRYTVQADGVPHKVLFGDLQGENDIVVLAGSDVTITAVEWTQDLTPDTTVEVLKTPAVSFDSSSVDEGTEAAVTASWAAVENAATYEVTFRGVTVEQPETSFVLDAATVAALPVGEYTLSVVAKPVATSSKFVKSEAGEAIFKVKKIVVGGEVTLTWDFDDPAFDSYYNAIGTETVKTYEDVWDGLTISCGPDAGSLKVGTSEGEGLGRYVQMAGAGSTTRRYFIFNAPASGTLKVTASNTGGSEDLDRMVTVNVNGEETSQAGGYAKSVPQELVFDITVDQPTDVMIYPTGNGLCFWKIEYTYVASSKPEPLYWGPEDFHNLWVNAFAGNTGNIDAAALTTATQISGMTINADGWTYNGLEFLLGGGKFKFGQNNNNAGEKVTRTQFGGSGNLTKQVLIFEAPAAGTLKLEAVSSGDAPRPLAVSVDGGEAVQQECPDKTNNAVILEYDCSAAVAGSKIYIYSASGGINLFSITYEM